MECIVCRSKTISYSHIKLDILFHECLSCELIFKDPVHYITPTLEKAVYDLHENGIDQKGYVNFLTNFIESAVTPFITNEAPHALDFGSGPEPVLAHILENHFHIPTDIYDPYYANEKIADDKTYDVITSTEVIEHLSNPVDIFHTFKKHLKKEGILAVMTLFHPNDRTQFLDWFYIRDETHIVFYTTNTLKIIADIVGLSLIFDNAHRHATFKNKS